MSNTKHVILGAGLAGLSAAYHLAEPFVLFEAEPEVGGVARSSHIGGFTFDHAIHVLYTKDVYASQLIRSLLGDNFRALQRSAWIYSSGTITPYPYQTNLFGLPASVIFENLMGLFEARMAPAGLVKNFEEWICSTFGKGFAEQFMLPFNRKLWAADLQKMGFQWIADRVPQPDFAQILAGALALGTDHFGPNATFWYPRTGGITALASSFQNFIPPVRTNARAIRIDSKSRFIYFEHGNRCHYSNLISTIPLPRLVHIIDDVPDRIRELAVSLRANRVITVNIGIDRSEISDKHWIYFPDADLEFHRISFPMNFSNDLVPEGTSSIMVEISESDMRPIERKGLIARTIHQLRHIGVLREDDRILCSGITEIDPAYVIYGLDHDEVLNEIQHYLRERGIFSCGRFGAWRYLNMDHAILSGKEAAEWAMARGETTDVRFSELSLKETTE